MRCAGNVWCALATAVIGASMTAPVLAQPPTTNTTTAATDRRAGGELYDAYTTVTEMSVWMNAGKGHVPENMTGLADRAKEFYRSAHKAFMDGDQERAAGFALAADSAPFLRAAIPLIYTGRQFVMGTIEEQHGFDWIVPPEEPVEKAQKGPEDKNRPADAPTLRRRVDPPR